MNADLFKNFDQETYLARRLKDHGMGIFAGITDQAIRKERFRQAIIAGKLNCVIIGGTKEIAGKAETYADFFQRIYGEPLEPKPKRAKVT